MKKLIMIAVTLLMTLTASAQFEEGKFYCNGSLTGLGLSYNGNDKLNLGVEAKGGYLVADNWMVLAQVGYKHYGQDDMADNVSVGVGARYYIIQNGLYMGVNAKLVHADSSYNDFMPGIELGYAFFLNKSVTIEPSVYYDQSIKDHSKYSTVGLRIGVGIYL
jgi:hypothetical protein